MMLDLNLSIASIAVRENQTGSAPATNRELREDGSVELREDGSAELRE